MDEYSDYKKGLILFKVYFKAMLFAFTGGAVTLPILQEELDQKYGLMTRDKVLEYFALGQSIPGEISLNAGILIGREIAGIPGVVCVSAGIILPAFAGMIMIAAAYSYMTDLSLITGAINGIRAASVAIIAINAINLIRNGAKGKFGIMLTAASFLAVFLLRLEVLAVIIASGCFGILYEKYKERAE